MKTRLPRHLDVVEDDEGVLLVEAAGQRMVEAVVRQRDAVAADEFQAGRVHADTERQRVAAAGIGHRLAGIDRDLVGERRQRRQHARAADQDAVFGFFHRVQLGFVETGGDVALGFVGHRMDQGVGQTEVPAGQLLLERDEVGGAFLVAVDGPFVAAAGETRIGDVHVVRRAAHQADRELGDAAQRLVAAQQVVLASAG